MLLLAIPVVWWIARRTRTTLSPRHLKTVAGLRTLGIACLALALMRPQWLTESSDVSVVYALDVSRSIPSSFIESALEWIEEANRQARPARVSYVAFADRALTLSTLEELHSLRLAEGESFVLADIPGLIEGAHEGAGLGLQFLRHVERTRVLVHVVDSSGLSGRDPVQDLRAVREEVRRFEPALLERPQLVVASKRDAVADADPLPALRAEAEALGLPMVAISAVTGAGMLEMKRALLALVKTTREVTVAAAEPA